MASIDNPVNVGVGVIVRNERGDVLLGKRISDKHGKGEFSFPGGKPDPGEDPGFTALRELYEETGLVGYGMSKLDAWTYDVYPGIHYVTVYFQCWVGNDEPVNREPEKCEGWGWYSESSLPENLFCGVQEALDSCP